MKRGDNVMTAVRDHLKSVEEELCRVELVREVKEPAMLKRWWHIIVCVERSEVHVAEAVCSWACQGEALL